MASTDPAGNLELKMGGPSLAATSVQLAVQVLAGGQIKTT
jgi:hypothetical protein